MNLPITRIVKRNKECVLSTPKVFTSWFSLTLHELSWLALSKLFLAAASSFAGACMIGKQLYKVRPKISSPSWISSGASRAEQWITDQFLFDGAKTDPIACGFHVEFKLNMVARRCVKSSPVAGNYLYFACHDPADYETEPQRNWDERGSKKPFKRARTLRARIQCGFEVHTALRVSSRIVSISICVAALRVDLC